MKRADSLAPASPNRLLVPLLSLTYFVGISAGNAFAPALAALAAAFQISTGQAGQLGALSPLVWAALAPFTGVLSDRWGRRPLIAGGLLLMGVGTAGAALAPNVWLLAASRLVSGVGGAGFGPIVYALIADVLPPARRAPALGVVMAGNSAAALLGLPGVALLTGWLGWRWAFGALTAGLLALAGAVWVIAPRAHASALSAASGPQRAPRQDHLPHPPPTPVPAEGTLRFLRRNPATAAMLLGNMLHQGASACVATYTAAFLFERFGVPLREVGVWLALIAAGSVSGSLVGGHAARRGPLAISAGTCAASTVLAPLFLWGGLPLPVAALVAAVNAFAQSMRLPAQLSVVSDAAGERRGALLGLNATSNQTGFTLGAVMGGALLGATGYAGIGALAGAASAVACGIYVGLIRLRRTAPRPSPPAPGPAERRHPAGGAG